MFIIEQVARVSGDDCLSVATNIEAKRFDVDSELSILVERQDVLVGVLEILAQRCKLGLCERIQQHVLHFITTDNQILSKREEEG